MNGEWSAVSDATKEKNLNFPLKLVIRKSLPMYVDYSEMESKWEREGAEKLH